MMDKIVVVKSPHGRTAGRRLVFPYSIVGHEVKVDFCGVAVAAGEGWPAGSASTAGLRDERRRRRVFRGRWVYHVL